MTSALTKKHCQPCEGKTKPIAVREATDLLNNIPGWQIDQTGKSISREWITKNFITAVEFINKVVQIAEAENHHPDIHLTGYRKLRIELSTHAIGGLSENDFIVAALINELPIKLKK